MRRDQQIRINELLLQREELFLRVHTAEAEAARILGEPYPFTRPAIPSDRRAKRKPGAPPVVWPPPSVSAAATAVAPKPLAALTFRRLEAGEAAYRVTYRQFKQELVETHYDAAALATVLAGETVNLRILRVETVDAAGAVRATLLDRPEGK